MAKIIGGRMTEWVNVQSTAIRRVGYDSSSSTLYIDFTSSTPIYEYHGVPITVFREFINAPSVGRYYHSRIEHRYH